MYIKNGNIIFGHHNILKNMLNSIKYFIKGLVLGKSGNIKKVLVNLRGRKDPLPKKSVLILIVEVFFFFDINSFEISSCRS